uniref:Uncharacterized protein n=1 Tax=Arundo donax TaxID=35708 RepID=A0A0A9FF66_ARUDO
MGILTVSLPYGNHVTGKCDTDYVKKIKRY